MSKRARQSAAEMLAYFKWLDTQEPHFYLFGKDGHPPIPCYNFMNERQKAALTEAVVIMCQAVAARQPTTAPLVIAVVVNPRRLVESPYRLEKCMHN